MCPAGLARKHESRAQVRVAVKKNKGLEPESPVRFFGTDCLDGVPALAEAPCSTQRVSGENNHTQRGITHVPPKTDHPGPVRTWLEKNGTYPGPRQRFAIPGGQPPPSASVASWHAWRGRPFGREGKGEKWNSGLGDGKATNILNTETLGEDAPVPRHGHPKRSGCASQGC